MMIIIIRKCFFLFGDSVSLEEAICVVYSLVVSFEMILSLLNFLVLIVN